MAKTTYPFGEAQARAAMLTPTRIDQRQERRLRRQRQLALLVDHTLEDSFPASDPPSWTASIARPAPARARLARGKTAGAMRRALRRVASLF